MAACARAMGSMGTETVSIIIPLGACDGARTRSTRVPPSHATGARATSAAVPVRRSQPGDILQRARDTWLITYVDRFGIRRSRRQRTAGAPAVSLGTRVRSSTHARFRLCQESRRLGPREQERQTITKRADRAQD